MRRGGHFAAATVTLTEGRRIDPAPEAGGEVVRAWPAITDRTGEIVPAYGFVQAARPA